MDINFVDVISEKEAHCGNCVHWEQEGLFGFCEEKEENYPSFAICKAWKKRKEEEN